MKSNQPFGNGERQDGFVNELCLACRKRLKDGIDFLGRVEPVIFAMLRSFASGIGSFASPLGLFFNFFFHNKNGLFNFAETYQGRGGRPPCPSLESASYLEAYLYFPNLKNYFEAHVFRILVGFLPTPFQAFRIPLCNPSLITLQR